MASADTLIYSANSSSRMKPFILVTVTSSHLLHLLQESTTMCLMCSCLKMLKNWLELYHKIGKEGYGCVFGRIFPFLYF